MAYFDGIKVGDTVYYVNVPCEVKDLHPGSFDVYGDGGLLQMAVSSDGRVFNEGVQTVFWQPVHIDPPPRPKRKVSSPPFQKFLVNSDLEKLRRGECPVSFWHNETGSPHPVTVTIEYEE